MSYIIQESQTIATPAVSELLLSEGYKEQKKKRNNRLVIQVDSIHEGITKNYNKYTGEELQKATTSWLMPYPKPILLNHDLNSEPLGRMVNADYKVNNEGLGKIQLRANIADPLAAAKVIDGRYLTGSVGGIPKAALCSICLTDIIAASREGQRCSHERGSVYDEKVCVYEHRDIEFHEYSFVNVPGDSQSQIQSHVGESAIYEMAVYDVDFDTQVVKEFSSKEGIFDIREMMTESDAHKMYLDLAFGSKHAELYSEAEKSKSISFENNLSTIDQESGKTDLEQGPMTDKNKVDPVVESDDEDVLDVAGRLAAELNETDDAAEAEVASEEETDLEDGAAEDSDTAVVEETTDAEEADEKVVEDKDLTSEEDSGEAEAEVEVEETEAEADVTAEETEEVEEVAETDDSAETVEEQEVTDSQESEEVAEEAIDLQGRIDELEAENEKLRTQNKKMKDAIHTELAKKVVEARIAVGHLVAEDYEVALEEHKARTASSLADALVDIRTIAEKGNYEVKVINGTVPSLEIQARATSEDEAVVLEEDDELVQEEVVVDSEKVFVESLSGLLLNGVEKTLRNSK